MVILVGKELRNWNKSVLISNNSFLEDSGDGPMDIVLIHTDLFLFENKLYWCVNDMKSIDEGTLLCQEFGKYYRKRRST